MTEIEKQRVKRLRHQGESYARIAKILSLSENTIKSFCRRNRLGTGNVCALYPFCDKDACAHCGKLLTHTPGAKPKRFCSTACRMAWWQGHPERINRKALYRFVCPTCGRDFEAYGNARRKYCSRACASWARKTCHE